MTGSPGYPRLTHGRHCPCGACAQEDWTRLDLAPCGMHGAMCPRVYDPYDPAAYMQKAWESLPPAPRFDRIAAHDQRIFDSIPRIDGTSVSCYFTPAILGFPVVIDPDVEPGVIELRKGDEVVERFSLPWGPRV